MDARRTGVCLAAGLLLIGSALGMHTRCSEDGSVTVGSDGTVSRQPVDAHAPANPRLRPLGVGESSSAPPQATMAPAPQAPAWACDVSGRVLRPLEGSDPSAGRCLVTVMVRGSEGATEFEVSGDGAFGGRIPLPERSAVLECIARDRAGDGVSPLLVRKVVHGQRVGLAFPITEGALLRARVVGEDGQPVPDASIMVLERPVQQEPRAPAWVVERVLPVAQVVGCDEEGRVCLPVRPGRLEVRPLGRDRSRGAVSVFSIERGESLDAGDLRMPESSLSIRGSVLDADSRAPVEGAWVQLDGEVIRWRKDGQPASSIHSDRDGRFVVQRVTRAALPLRASVGSPSHEATGILLDGSAGEVVVELQPRPVLRIRVSREGAVPPPQGDALVKSASWTVRNEHTRTSSGVKAGSGRSASYWVRDVLLRGRPEVRPGQYPGELIARPPYAGGYRVSMRLPGGVVSTAQVSLAQGEDRTVVLEVPEVRPTRLRFHLKHDGVELRKKAVFRLTWLAADGADLAPAGQLDHLTENPCTDLLLWRPVAADGIRATPGRPGLSPYEEAVATLDTSPDSVTDIHLSVQPDTARVEFQLTYRDQPIPLGRATIWLVPIDLTGPGQLGMTTRTDATGHAWLQAPQGTYRAMSLKHLGEPRWVSVVVAAGETSFVRVPTDP